MMPQVVLYDYAMKLVGLPYRWGGDDPINGFDCSGLVQELLQSCGVYPAKRDTNAAGLWQFFDVPVTTAPNFGTLAFFGAAINAIHHVGFCLNETQMLEAGGGGSTTLTAKDAADKNAYVRVRPIRFRKDLVGLKHPTYPWKG